ncbi:MAG TPA: RNA polymerase sporulation sigma factor SigH [Candidatus Copromorpha excrementigallinarum]|uniref:RNA polymerase sigma factor SigS n=1 Tax=Candidatus Allocopromorpha excrementigallinarum TaxID=2840742 RepID=A0A9D1HZN4_9FIRM|nr:RNA polymerase sporulation sigma factor SigH [Candidatus Copromorpha excrementigallinarum]
MKTDLYRKLEECADSQLVAMAQEGDIDAEEALMRRYKETVRIKAKLYFMAGADEEDVVQEGMIGLLKAIRQYNEEKSAAFGTFASICITRQIISAIRGAGREKHRSLNNSVSLSNPLEREGGEITLEDTLKAGMDASPEELLVIKDVVYYIFHNGDNIFSDFEMQVLNEFLKGKKYDRIARDLGKSTKSIDNAMQRTKKKIVEYITR